MVSITWLGEDEPDLPGPSYTVWNGVKFPKDVAVDMDAADIPEDIRQHMIRKAKAGGRFFKVKEANHGEEEKEQQPSKEDKKDQVSETGYSPLKKKPDKKKTPDAPAAGASPDA